MLKRTFSLVFSIIFFLGNTALAHTHETNIWKERRKNQLVLAQFPSPTAPPPYAELKPRSFSDLSFRRKNLPTNLSDLIEAIPPQIGNIRGIDVEKYKSSEKIVFHIQDIHQNSEAQKHIAQAIENLLRENKVDLVALEGAFEELPLPIFREFPFLKTLRTLAGIYLIKNEISGPIKAGLTTQHNIPAFIGIDDKTTYETNTTALKASQRFKDANKIWLTEELKNTIQQKEKTFSASLKAFDAVVQAYHQGDLSMGAYLKTLATYTHPSASIETFLKALDYEQRLNFDLVEKERTQLLMHLGSQLPTTESSTLLNFTIAFRGGDLDQADFYRYLETLCAKNGLALSQYPSMQRYIQYLLLSEKIDSQVLFTESKHLEDTITNELIKTAQEKELIKKSNFLVLANKLLEFSLTPNEWKEYKRHRNAFPRKDSLEPFERFYRAAEQRDSLMALNLLREMDQTQSRIAVLVTGGFHSEGIKNKLKDAGVSTISFVPKITKVDLENNSAYLGVFAQEKTPLEKLFQGEKLFLATHPFSRTAQFRLAHEAAAPLLKSGTLSFEIFQAWIHKTIQGLLVLSYRNRGSSVEFEERLNFGGKNNTTFIVDVGSKVSIRPMKKRLLHILHDIFIAGFSERYDDLKIGFEHFHSFDKSREELRHNQTCLLVLSDISFVLVSMGLGTIAGHTFATDNIVWNLFLILASFKTADIVTLNLVKPAWHNIINIFRVFIIGGATSSHGAQIDPSVIEFVRQHESRLSELRLDQADVLRKRFLEQKTLTTIATEMGTDKVSVLSRLQTALKRLRRLIGLPESHIELLIRKHQHRLQELDDRTALLLKRRFIENKENHDIAKELGVKRKTVPSLLKVAIKIFQRYILSDEISPTYLVRKNSEHVRTMKEPISSILIGRFINGKTQRELAEERGVTDGTIRYFEAKGIKELNAREGRGAGSDSDLVKSNQHRLVELSEKHAALLTLRFLEGKTQLEISKMWDTPRYNLSVQEKAALNELRKLITSGQTSLRFLAKQHPDLVDQLPPEESSLIRQLYFENKSQRFLSRREGITPQAISSRHKRAEKLFRHLINNLNPIKPDSPDGANVPLTLPTTLEYTHRFLNRHPHFHAWAMNRFAILKIANTDEKLERIAQLYVAPWYELPWSLLPWFALLHDNKNKLAAFFLVIRHVTFVIIPTTVPFLFSMGNTVLLNTIAGLVFHVAGHALHNLIFPLRALSLGEHPTKRGGWTKINSDDKKLIEMHQDRLAELKPIYTQILKARFLNEDSVEKIARELGVTKPSATARIKSALKALRELLNADPFSIPSLVYQHRERLDELNPRYATYLRGRFVEKKTQPQLAEELNLKRGSILALEYRAIAAFRQWILGDEVAPGFLVKTQSDLLLKIPPKEALVLKLLHINGKLKKDVAATLGLSADTVSARERRGLEKLRQLMDPNYLDPAELVVKHKELLKQLPDNVREILWDIYIDGKKLNSIARGRNTRLSSVQKLRDKALRKLRNLVSVARDREKQVDAFLQATGQYEENDKERILTVWTEHAFANNIEELFRLIEQEGTFWANWKKTTHRYIDPYWKEHIKNNHANILKTAESIETKDSVIILGAGECNDIPLEALAKVFNVVHLIDIDREGMEKAKSKLDSTPEYQNRIKIHVQDLTSGKSADFKQKAFEIINKATDAETAVKQLQAFWDAFDPHLTETPFVPLKSDLVVSSLNAIQLFKSEFEDIIDAVQKKFSVDVSLNEKSLHNKIEKRHMQFVSALLKNKSSAAYIAVEGLQDRFKDEEMMGFHRARFEFVLDSEWTKSLSPNIQKALNLYWEGLMGGTIECDIDPLLCAILFNRPEREMADLRALLPSEIADALHEDTLSAEQSLILVNTLTQITRNFATKNPQDHGEIFPAGFSAKKLGEWYYIQNPLPLLASRIEGYLLQLKPSSYVMTLPSTVKFTERLLRDYPSTPNLERFTQLYVAPWYELPWTLLPWFALLHNNKGSGESLIRFLGHYGFILFPTAIPFLLPFVDSIPLKTIFSIGFNMGGHFLFNLIVPQFALTRNNVWNHVPEPSELLSVPVHTAILRQKPIPSQEYPDTLLEQTLQVLQPLAPASLNLANAFDTPKASNATIVHIYGPDDLEPLKIILARLSPDKTGDLIALVSKDMQTDVAQIMAVCIKKGYGAVVSNENVASYDDVLSHPSVRGLRRVQRLIESGYKEGQLTVVSTTALPLTASEALTKIISLLTHTTDGWVRVNLETQIKSHQQTKRSA